MSQLLLGADYLETWNWYKYILTGLGCIQDALEAGAFAAFSVDLLVYPLDTLKTRFQSPDYKKFYYNASQTAIDRRVLFRGLYQGIGSVILVTLPSSGAFFTTYEGMKSVLSKANPVLSGSSSPLIPLPVIHSVASVTAELISCFILTPAEVLKQNAQMIRQPDRSSAPKSTGILQKSVSLQALGTISKPSQLWTGYTALAMRNLPYTGMQLPMFEFLKTAIKEKRKTDGTLTGELRETAVITALSAGSAGSVAAVITTPVDVIKTRIMLSAAGDKSESEAKKDVELAKKEGRSLDKLAESKGVTRKGSLAIAQEILNERGVRGLFRGGALRAVWTAVGSGLFFGIYESSRVWLGDRRGTAAEEP